MSRRHSRQRSSVSVKKRSSLVQDRSTNIDEIHDNALSNSVNNNKDTEAVEASQLQDYFSLGSPYPGTYAKAGESGRMDSSSSHNNNNESDDDTMWSFEKENLPASQSDMTTRTELDLFEDEEEGSISTASSSQQPAPKVPPKEMSPLPLKRIKAFTKDASALQSASAHASPRSPAYISVMAKTPSRQHSLSGASSTSSNMTGDRRLSLLAGGSVLGPGSPSSPSSVRTITPTTAHNRGSSATKMHPVKRMSLSYVPSPIRTKFNGSMSYDSTTPSAVGTPPASSSSTSAYFGRLPTSNPGTPNVPSSAGARSVSYSPTLLRSNSRREDGDTVMTQHIDLLGRIAQGERRILDLKEMLEKEERDLRQLQREWQASVNRELIASGPGNVQPKGGASAKTVADQSALNAELEQKGNFTTQPTTTAASEGWKVISERLAGAGNQLNAFIDQLAAPVPEEKRKSEETVRAASAGLGLDILQEEAEESDVLQTGSKDVPPAPPVKNFSSTATSKQAKRTSVFGNSMAVLQKQMEAQFGVMDIKKQETTSNGDAGGWGTWQKRLKEARENASGLLAKAEAKIGQALTLDDLTSSGAAEAASSKNAAKANNRGNLQSPSGGSIIDFESENDREKAALAELSWLNSLAGINMSGTTDRVVTSPAAEVRAARAASRSPEMRSRKIWPDTAAEQDSSLARKTSVSSRRESGNSHASTSRMTSTTSATTVTSGPHSPGASLNGENKEQSFFSRISTGWAPQESSSGEKRQSHQRQASNGHSKTRIAAEVAMQEKRSSMPPAQDSDAANDEKAWGL